MGEVERITKQLQRTFEGKAWHGPSVEEVLADVTAPVAAAKTGASHTIWQMVSHIAIWEDAVRRWLTGDTTRPKDEETWPASADTSEAAWQAALEHLRKTHHALLAEVAKLDEARLSERIMDGMPSVYTTLHGVVQHNLYHAGQIAVLKKSR